MSEEINEVKIDRSTLPIDGQKVYWQTRTEAEWKEGVFVEDGNSSMFCEGFADAVTSWYDAWDVIRWRDWE